MSSSSVSSSRIKNNHDGNYNPSKKIRTVNPYTEEVINEYSVITREEVFDVARKSKKAFKEWRKDYGRRTGYLYAFANELKKERDELAKVATMEMGKTIKEARSEIDKCAWAVEYFADNGGVFLHDEVINTDARKSIVTFEPLGVIASLMPWNFPYWQALRFAAPSLIAGNTIILKPSSVTMQCGLEIERIFEKIGLPDFVFKTVVASGAEAGYLIDSEDVSAVTFTGSVPVGAKVAQHATSRLKKIVLELGGSDPFIVCEDADIDKASSGAVKGRFINCGQSCIASKRFIVVKNIANQFLEKFIEKTERLKIGNPLSEETDIGPLVNQAAVENIDEMVKRAIKEGAELVTGGQRLGNKGQKVGEDGGNGSSLNKGYFYKPTILKNVTPKMEVAREETFGPVAPVIVVEDEQAAIEIANDTQFGLGASVWTQNLNKAEKYSKLLQAGIVTVNNVVISDPRVPFGGIKNSGFGRELSKHGMFEFVNIKSIRFYDQLVHQHYVE
ncbi:NAD-dependent succinate-semialdehyde dehydrogenase [Candidatus Nitrosocosmicus franklandus]|uniref:Putative succinate-semialdehyde dehydrogenase [NADP(+)] n=1 Tax=Candidatus Nitrosocosmicus franklandianus TaxID=1798806 RepID=A0A484I9Q0_9ARCH|nr:NAD-dependent succinate-semialdehyde dehydrogenase [Candidatus Nitrosocosmicus franklandus]VFJ12957.1 putative succinate-semialdehyde dehydrogenase [NADP(+)] [Candidatus Nitrosocosmicus franklandus]